MEERGGPRKSDRRKGYWINRKRVWRLMRKMGLMAIYQKSDTGRPHPEHKI